MTLQDHIVQGLEELEASVPPNTYNSSATAPTFHRDHWLRPQGGEGSSCVLANGRVEEGQARRAVDDEALVISLHLPDGGGREYAVDDANARADGALELPVL
jgi:hypothetical protein